MFHYFDLSFLIHGAHPFKFVGAKILCHIIMTGTIFTPGHRRLGEPMIGSLGLENIAMRGTQLENTEHVYGVAVYTGQVILFSHWSTLIILLSHWSTLIILLSHWPGHQDEHEQQTGHQQVQHSGALNEQGDGRWILSCVFFFMIFLLYFR